jgi:hypothetical protein
MVADAASSTINNAEYFAFTLSLRIGFMLG